MARKKKKKPGFDADWAKAKQRCRLNMADIRMAKELGLNPRKLVNPSPSQPWKAPVKVWIRELYEKKHPPKEPAAPPPPAKQERIELPLFPSDLAEDSLDPDELDWFDEGPLDDRRIAEQDAMMLRRQREFALAAEYVSREFSLFPEVVRVVLFGSVARPLRREVPRFREFRRAGIECFHECKDVDLAVWVTRLDGLRELGRARGRALNDLLALEDVGVAHHQVDVFLMEPGTDHYLGRLCTFGVCPKGKPECRVPDCGKALFLQQHQDFRFWPEALGADRTRVLFERKGEDRAKREEIPL
jgi:hypothetical protein